MFAFRRVGRPSTVLAVMMSLTVVMAGCSRSESEAASTPGPTLTVPTIASEVRDHRGSIVGVKKGTLAAPPLSTSASARYNVVYESVSGVDGTARSVSGTVFVPPGPAPEGGWPIIAYGHGTTGITPDCGPSEFPDLLGYDQVVASLLDLGFVVSLTDYEGLGHDGRHPFLEPRTAAFNLIDSVRAARNVVPDASDRWLAVGVAQGGQASWAANELAGSYGDGLHFLGSASQSPFVDFSGLPDLAEAGWLTRSQQILLPTLVEGLQVTHPDLRPEDYLHGVLAERRDVWLACSGPLAAEAGSVDVGATDGKPASPAATARLRKVLRDYALPQWKASGPMLVITGGDDDVVRSQWVSSAVKRACRQGDSVELIVRSGEKQSNLDAGPRIAAWVGERLTDAPPVNTCGS